MLQKETKIVADKISPFHNVFQTTESILGRFSEKKGKVVRKFYGNLEMVPERSVRAKPTNN